MITIFKKELARFFGDKRMVITSILMPGLLIYLLYSLMGTAFSEQDTADEAVLPVVAVVNLPASMESGIWQSVIAADAQEARELIAAAQVNAALIFPENFDVQVAAYEIGNGETPEIELYYNSASADSQATYMLLFELLDGYEQSLVNKFDVTAADVASETEAASSYFAQLLPLLLMMFLVSGCMAVAPESIAGEKERGTIATLLITPIGRNKIALGKIAALSIFALLSGISSTLGTILSLPKLMGGEISGNIYGLYDYLLLAVVILSTVLLLVTLISVISAFAKTTKEAQTLVMPLTILSSFVGITAMFGSVPEGSYGWYLIPLYNSVQSMVSIFSFSGAAMPVLLTAVSNVVYAGLGVFVLTKLFRSERILYTA